MFDIFGTRRKLERLQFENQALAHDTMRLERDIAFKDGLLKTAQSALTDLRHRAAASDLTVVDLQAKLATQATLLDDCAADVAAIDEKLGSATHQLQHSQHTSARLQEEVSVLEELLRHTRNAGHRVEQQLGQVHSLEDKVGQWVERCFGASAMAVDERLARVLEETFELVQSEGIPFGRVAEIAFKVYERPPGDPNQELGGVGTTLIAYAKAKGTTLLGAVMTELDRITSKSPEHFRRRQAEKAAAGISKPLVPEEIAA